MAKIERGHRDLEDVRAMLEQGLVTSDHFRPGSGRIEPNFWCYPAVSPRGFEKPSTCSWRVPASDVSGAFQGVISKWAARDTSVTTPI